MNINSPIITVIDDDESVRESLPDLIREFGFSVNSFASAEDFLESDALDTTNCLILDVGMPRMSGPDLQMELRRRQQRIPIVFITANVDETDRHGLIKNGAIDCLFKPFNDTELLRAVNTALQTG